MNQWKHILLPLAFWITGGLVDCLILPPVSAQTSEDAILSLTDTRWIPSHILDHLLNEDWRNLENRHELNKEEWIPDDYGRG